MGVGGPLTRGHWLDAGVILALEQGEPSIVVDGAATSVTICPQTLQPGEAEIIAARLREILPPR